MVASPWRSRSWHLSDVAVGEGRRPAQPLPLHLEPAAFIVGHALGVDLQLGLNELPHPLLGLQLSVRLTWTQRHRRS